MGFHLSFLLCRQLKPGIGLKLGLGLELRQELGLDPMSVSMWVPIMMPCVVVYEYRVASCSVKGVDARDGAHTDTRAVTSIRIGMRS